MCSRKAARHALAGDRGFCFECPLAGRAALASRSTCSGNRESLFPASTANSPPDLPPGAKGNWGANLLLLLLRPVLLSNFKLLYGFTTKHRAAEHASLSLLTIPVYQR